MTNKLVVPKNIVAGENAIYKAKNIIKEIGKKAFIVTDETIIKIGLFDILKDVLCTINIDYSIYSSINKEPDDTMVYEGIKQYTNNECDFIIALGGGSPIDVAKAIGFMLENKDNLISDYVGIDIKSYTPRIVAIPTTAGTGSEVTRFSIINNSATKVKMLLYGESLVPYLAIVDPIFTLSSPNNITINTGLDALCHAIESYTSKKSQPLTEEYALKSIKKIIQNLDICINDPKNIKAREQMSLAAMEAGISFSNSSVTLIHGLSRPLGAIFHIPHGLSNALLMMECLKFAVIGAEEKFSYLYDCVDNNKNENDINKKAYDFIDFLNNYIEHFKLPKLSELGVDKKKYMLMIEKMSNDAIISGSPGNTIREINIKDIQEIYKKIYK